MLKMSYIYNMSAPLRVNVASPVYWQNETFPGSGFESLDNDKVNTVMSSL